VNDKLFGGEPEESIRARVTLRRYGHHNWSKRCQLRRIRCDCPRNQIFRGIHFRCSEDGAGESCRRLTAVGCGTDDR
jgi:hypothetical protein